MLEACPVGITHLREHIFWIRDARKEVDRTVELEEC
jgi:hypothetical protein